MRLYVQNVVRPCPQCSENHDDGTVILHVRTDTNVHPMDIEQIIFRVLARSLH